MSFDEPVDDAAKLSRMTAECTQAFVLIPTPVEVKYSRPLARASLVTCAPETSTSTKGIPSNGNVLVVGSSAEDHHPLGLTPLEFNRACRSTVEVPQVFSSNEGIQ